MKALQQITYTNEAAPFNPLMSIDTALQRIFKPAAEETKLQNARSAMGSELGTLPDEDLEVYLTEFQHLIDCWLDAYEKRLFDGLTLRQLLGQG